MQHFIKKKNNKFIESPYTILRILYFKAYVENVKILGNNFLVHFASPYNIETIFRCCTYMQQKYIFILHYMYLQFYVN